MEALPNHSILTFSPDILLEIRSKYNLDKAGDMDKAVDVLQNWLKQQEHITSKTFSKDYLERIIITNKCSIERAKIAIDRMCTVRTLLPRFFEKTDVRDIYKNIEGTFLQVQVLPKPTKDHVRVFVPQILRNGFTSGMMFNALQLCALYCDYFKAVDYSDRVIIISDFTNVDIVNGMKALNLVDIRQALSIIIDGFNIRLKSVHLISSSSAIDLFVTFMKSILKKKIGDRICIHKSMEELHQFVPKEILPSDFGGDDRTLKEIFADWMDVLSSDETLTLIKDIRSNKTNEKYRTSVEFNEHYMGMPGSFRTLTLD